MDNTEQTQQKIHNTVRKNQHKLDADSHAIKARYPQKIETLSKTVYQNCQSCSEAANHQKMLMELAGDLPKIANPSPSVKRSIEKRFKVITNHLQGEHGFSVQGQFRDGGIVVGGSILGMTGFVIMAFNMIILYPIAGFVIGGFLGYLWGSRRDKRAEETNKMLKF